MYRSGITHSLFAVILFSLPVAIYDLTYSTIFALGYLSHVIGDLTTPMGVKLFYPVINKRYSLNLIRSGKVEELIIFYLSILIIFKFGFDQIIQNI